METKYYTPEPDEFHVGFEYEVWSKVLVKDEVLGFKVNKNMFTIKHLTQTYFSYNLQLDLQEEKIRVKYLDQEDIESLGFIYHDCLRDGGTSIFKKDDIELVYHGSNKLTPNLQRVSIKRFFDGNIKNKSELIKLLKQLNIMK